MTLSISTVKRRLHDHRYRGFISKCETQGRHKNWESRLTCLNYIIGKWGSGQYEVSVCVQSQVRVGRRWAGNNSAVSVEREVCLPRCEAWCHSYISLNPSWGVKPVEMISTVTLWPWGHMGISRISRWPRCTWHKFLFLEYLSECRLR